MRSRRRSSNYEGQAGRDDAHFTAKQGRLHVTVYEKGLKALVQGNEVKDFTSESMSEKSES